MFAFKVVTIDRAKSAAAHAVMARAVENLRRREGTIAIAPEGTRTRTGTLGPFKMGLFHMALESGAPIQPVILRGVMGCLPMGSLMARPGIIEIEVLPEIVTDDYTVDNLKEKRDELRRLFVEGLGTS